MNWQSLLVGGTLGVLPGILQLVEVLHARKPGEAPTGPTKAGAAVSLAQNVLTVAAAAGVIPNADAQNISAIASLVQQTVEDMKAEGRLGGHAKEHVPVTIDIPTQQVSTGKFTPAPTALLPPVKSVASTGPGKVTGIDLSKYARP